MSKGFFFAGRKKARRFALQALFGWMFSHNALSDIESHTLLEHAEVDFDKAYFHDLLFEVPGKINELADLVSPYLSRKIEDLDAIELTILRISAYELKYRPDIPYKVIINEALELAKTFGATDSHKFINGVLDKAARELRKNEI